MSFKHSSVASVVTLRPLPQSAQEARMERAVASTESSEWRSLGGVAFAILADLDRRRPKLVAPPQHDAETKAA